MLKPWTNTDPTSQAAKDRMNPQILSILNHGGIVVTATKRLRYEVKAAYDADQIRQNKIVWPSASIFTWDGWMQHLWQAVQAEADIICLNTAQLQQLFINIIQADLSNNPSNQQMDLTPLWNIPATAKTAVDAWQQCHEWKIAYSPLQQSEIVDHARFGRWATRLYAHLQSHKQISAAQLPDYLLANGHNLEKQICLTGFDHLNTQQQTFISQHNERDGRVSQLNSTLVENATVSRYVFENALSEWQQIGAWARQILLEDSNKKLGIICPDIEKIRQPASNALREQLTPDYYIQPVTAPFHFSQGSSLAETPVVKAMLSSLSLLGQIEFSQLSPIFLSAYWGEQQEQLLRARLLLDLRTNIAYQFDLFQLIQALSSGKIIVGGVSGGAEFIAKLSALQTLKANHRGEYRLSEWRTLFRQALELMGWQVKTFDSDEFQAWQAWSNSLDSWMQLDIVCPPMKLTQALTSLKSHCQKIQFQAQAQANAPVQILGILESAELEFDAVWLAGFDEQSWPASRHINPFIPIQKQIEAGIPYALPEQQLKLAHKHSNRLLGMCTDIRVSHARVMDDLDLDISPLMSQIQVTSTNGLPRVFSLLNTIRNASPELITISDDTGFSFDHDIAAGGTGLIQKQSACPFAAYAQYRLNLRYQDEPDAGMDNLIRGNLLHEILASVWEALKDSSALTQHIHNKTLKALVEKYVQKHLPQKARNSGLKEGFLQAEAQRLTDLIYAWLVLEAERPAFKVIANEQQIEHSINGLKLNFYLDRVDHVPTRHGSPLSKVTRMIIDYKSGRCDLKSWAGNRPEQPQMPLYYLALKQQNPTPEISALAFAQIKQDDCHFVGLSQLEQSLPEVKSLNELSKTTALKKELEDWSQLTPVWQATMENLVAEFQQGVANVDPKSSSSCNYCNFAPLCRIGSAAQEQEDDSK